MIVCSTLPPACKRLTRFWFDARERDAVAREELFQSYREDAYRVAYRMLGHQQDALDVVQEASPRPSWDSEILTVAAGFGTGFCESLAPRPWIGDAAVNGVPP